MDKKLMLELPKYLSKITPQVAVGGGEPLMEPLLLTQFAHECRRNGLICNVTSNGSQISKWTDEQLQNVLKDITMVSLSWDAFKQTMISEKTIIKTAGRIKKLGIEVGMNLLMDKILFYETEATIERLFMIVMAAFHTFDRVFALYPKNMPLGVDILEHKIIYEILTTMYKHFYVDDLTNKILTEGYEWKTPCHYGNNIVNIDLDGSVHGCSFSPELLLQITDPRDVLKLAELPKQNRMKCPYLVR
jgi:MoaA/NifB/PqqE/SkfB family radical SAM enzyme